MSESRAKELKQQIDILNQKIGLAQGAKRALEQELANLVCPFSVGDTIEWEQDGRNKTTTRGVITQILPNWDESKLHVHAARILKNGDQGQEVSVPWWKTLTLVEEKT